VSAPAGGPEGGYHGEETSLQDEFREPDGRHFVRPQSWRWHQTPPGLSHDSRALDPRERLAWTRVTASSAHRELPCPAPRNRDPAASWDVVVDGLVTNPTKWSLNSVASMASERRIWDLNCVWGWSKLQCVWDGVPAGRLIDAAQPLPEARFVMASSVGGGYTSCFSLKRVRRSLLAWSLDGAELTLSMAGRCAWFPRPRNGPIRASSGSAA